MKDILITYLWKQREHSIKAFGPGMRTQGLIDHITKELREVEQVPDDLEEWVDIITLGFDGARRCGITPDKPHGHPPEVIIAALLAKQEVNCERNWPDWRTSDPNKAIEHVKSEDGPDFIGWDTRAGFDDEGTDEL